MRVVICGAGIVGACTAYFLGRREVEVIVVERTGIACAASGKAGGFLALDWCDGSPLGPLARRSFALHAELAERLGGTSWGYRRLDSWSVHASEDGPSRPRGAGGPAWLGDSAVVRGRLSTRATTAQVHPARFTEAMMQAAERHGARLQPGVVERVLLDPQGSRVVGVLVDGAVLAADAVVIAMGPWSTTALCGLPLPPVSGLKGNSVVLETGDAISADAVFVDLVTSAGAEFTPEVFPRGDGTTYVCGFSPRPPLPADPAAVGPDPGAADALRAMLESVAPTLARAPLRAVQACFRPVTQDGLPLLGPVAGIDGAFVATGHSVWGILNAPASGEAMAELIVEGAARQVELGPFDPARRMAG